MQLLKELCDRLHWPSAVYTHARVPMPGSADAHVCTVALEAAAAQLHPSEGPWKDLPAPIIAALRGGVSSGLRRSQAESRLAAAQNMLSALAPGCAQPQGSIHHLVSVSQQVSAEQA